MGRFEDRQGAGALVALTQSTGPPRRGHRGRAAVGGADHTLLAYNVLRIDEALSRDVEHLGHQLGHRVVRITRKGGRDALEPLSPPVERTLDRYLAGRTTGPLFLDDQGRRMYEAQAWRLVRRLARRTGIKSAREALRQAAVT